MTPKNIMYDPIQLKDASVFNLLIAAVTEETPLVTKKASSTPK